jgi:hypothetical protein
MRKHAKPEPKLIGAPENAAGPPALVFEQQLKSAQSVPCAKPDVAGTEVTAEAVVVPEESYINEGELAAVSSTPIANEPPALFATNELKPATPAASVISGKPAVEGREFAAPIETVISAKPEVQTFTTKAGVVLQRAPIEEGLPAPVSPHLSKKVHFGLLPGIDEVFTEQPPPSLEEIEAFSTICNGMFRSKASNINQASGAPVRPEAYTGGS